uniref:Glutamate receptor n=1 Tax=Petromyzon marinus TaxID=7757 RepID=A0AAJ7SJZ5_PETMA|nr:glutamate receptor 4-like isoform X5 [Petromyzon marinus]
MACLSARLPRVSLCVLLLLNAAQAQIYAGSMLLLNASGQESGAFAVGVAALGGDFRASDSSAGAGGSAFTLVQSLCEQLSQGVFSLTAQTSGPAQTQTLLSFCRRLALPCLLVSPPSAPRNEGGHGEEEEVGVGGPVTPLSLAPDPGPALADLVSYYGWKDFVYLHDGDDPSTLSSLLSSPRGPWEVTVFHVGGLDGRSLRSLLDPLDPLDPLDQRHQRFLIACSNGGPLQELLKQIVAMGKHIRGYNYILSSLDFSTLDLTAFHRGGANVSGLQLLDFARPQLKELLQQWRKVKPLSMSSPDSYTLKSSSALVYDSLLVLRAALQRLPGASVGARDTTSPCLQSSWEHGNRLASSMREVVLEGASGPLGFDSAGKRSKFTLQVMEMSSQGPSKVGYWNPEERLVVTRSAEATPDPRKINTTLVITTIMDSPYFMMKPNHAVLRGNARYEGYVVDLAEELSRALGFSYVLSLVPDGRYGRREPGTRVWQGMIGEVLYGRADLAVAPLTITSERAAVVDFTKPFMTVGISAMLLGGEAALPGGSLSLLAPLGHDTWLCLLLALLGVGSVLFVLSRFSPYEGGGRGGGAVGGGGRPPATPSTKVAIGDSLWGAFNLLIQHGSHLTPRAWSVRVLSGAWSLFALLLVAAYTASLVALLLSTRAAPSAIASLDDLASQGALHYGTLDGGSTQNFFRESKFPVYQRMWSSMQSARPSPFVRSNAEGVARVRASGGRFAFLLESPTNEYISQRAPCDTRRVGRDINQRGYGIAMPRGSQLRRVGRDINQRGYGIAMPRGSQLRSALDLAILKLNEGGVLQQIKQKWWYDKGECGHVLNTREGPQPLSLSAISSLFYLLLAGVALALFVGVLEKCVRPSPLLNAETEHGKQAGQALT